MDANKEITLTKERVRSLYHIIVEAIVFSFLKNFNGTTQAETTWKNFKDVRDSSSDLKCQYCCNQLTACGYCRDCACMIDDRCFVTHHNDIIHMLTHSKISFNDNSTILDFAPKVLCKLHYPDVKKNHMRELEYYCFNCKCNVCPECLNTHNTHKYIRINNIEDLIIVLKDFLQVYCSAGNRYIDQFKGIMHLICEDAIRNHELQFSLIEEIVAVIRKVKSEKDTCEYLYQRSGEHLQHVVHPSDEQNTQTNALEQAADVHNQRSGEHTHLVVQPSGQQNTQEKAPEQELEAFVADAQNHLDSFVDVHPPN